MLKLLIVEDEPAVREALVRALETEGYDLEIAEDGAQALALMASSPADALVLDVMLPAVDGLEVARRLRAQGSDAPILMLTARGAVGDRVAWASVPGSYADALVAPVDRLVRVPDGVTLEVAAAAMLQGMTAHYLAHGTRETRRGDTALVHAAAGGVGLLIVQTLRDAGARVIGTCSTAEKEALARDAGAHEVIRYDRVDFADETRRLTDGRGVDVVYDGVGKATFDGSLRALRVRGLCVLYGQASGAVPPPLNSSMTPILPPWWI